MKLYILQRQASYDELRGVVVRAESSRQARRLASSYRGDEGEDVWMDKNQTTCRQVKNDGKPEVILCDFYEA